MIWEDWSTSHVRRNLVVSWSSEWLKRSLHKMHVFNGLPACPTHGPVNGRGLFNVSVIVSLAYLHADPPAH